MSVVVTGAAGAIGAAIARSFAAQGVRVVAQDVRAASLPYENVVEIQGDLRERECLDRLGAAVATSGATAVVAAHGTFGGSGPLASLEPDAVRRTVDVNFGVLPHLLDGTLDALRARHGVFVAVASQAALRVEPGAPAYTAAKCAVKAWADAADRQLRAQGVRVRVVCPGRTESPMLDEALELLAKAEGISRAAYEEQCRRLIPAGRFGRPEDIAAAVQYLVDGGARPGLLAVNGGEIPW
jgi:NAD(P)-dependent dehydrogenase (short-subunit alcohol dehydrogenase family)